MLDQKNLLWLNFYARNFLDCCSIPQPKHPYPEYTWVTLGANNNNNDKNNIIDTNNDNYSISTKPSFEINRKMKDKSTLLKLSYVSIKHLHQPNFANKQPSIYNLR